MCKVDIQVLLLIHESDQFNVGARIGGKQIRVVKERHPRGRRERPAGDAEMPVG
jgi:hypothetical protein